MGNVYNDPPTEIFSVRGGEVVDVTLGNHVVSGRALWVGAPGNVQVTSYSGDNLVFNGCAAGTMIPVAFTAVIAAGTSVANGSLYALR